MRRGARHRKRRATPLAAKRARPLRVGQIGPPGALRRLPHVPHRAARRASPAGPFAAMKWVNIKDGWYKAPSNVLFFYARLRCHGRMDRDLENVVRRARSPRREEREP